jgi:hypothetical protein
MGGNLHQYYMGIGKNGSSKRSTNLAGFPRFSKKPAKPRTHRRKRSLAEPHKPTRPTNATFKTTLPQKYGQQKGPPNLAALLISVTGGRSIKACPFQLLDSRFGCLFLGR